MSTADRTDASTSYVEATTREYEDTSGDGWVVFAGTMLAMVGTLNVIDGIAAISKSTFFTENARFIISDLNTFGWVVLILGSLQVLVALGIWAKTRAFDGSASQWLLSTPSPSSCSSPPTRSGR